MRKTTLVEIDRQLGLIQQFFVEGRAPAPTFFKPFYMAALSCAIRASSVTDFNLRGTAADYALRMEVWEAAGFDPPRPARKRAPNRFQPCRALHDAQQMDRSARSIAGVFRATRSSEDDDLFTVFHELIENCFSHSAVDDGHFGVTCAQCWPNGNLGQIAIVDSGIGVRRSLSENRSLLGRLELENSCEMALEKGVSGKLGRGHSGYGLALAAGVAHHFSANLILVSGDEAVRVFGDRSESSCLVNGWRGSMVLFEWALNRRLDTAIVYDEWSEEEEDDEFMF